MDLRALLKKLSSASKLIIATGFFLLLFLNPIYVFVISNLQAEVAVGLNHLYHTQVMHFQGSGEYTESMADLNFGIWEDSRYVYFTSPTEYSGLAPSRLGLPPEVDLAALGAPVPGLPPGGWTAVAIGNVDFVPDLDVWTVDQTGRQCNVHPDVKSWLGRIIQWGLQSHSPCAVGG